MNIQNIQPTNCENNSTISTPNNNNPQTRNQIQHSNSNDMKPMCYQFLQNYANNPLNQGKNEREQQANGSEIVLNGQKIVLNSQNNNNQNSPLQPNNNSNQNNINRNLNMFSNANNDASNIPSEIDLAKKEGEIGANLKVRHPNIISLFEYFEKDGTVFIIIEYCPNGSLNDYIKKNGPMKPPMLYSFCYQILGALNACHNKKVAHRDIKPSNILIDQHGRPKICDFGLSLDLENSIDKKITSRGGSLYWMAPEIFDPNVKNNGFDPFKADVWALGVTFYQMAMGKLPWIISGSDHREHQQEVIKSIKFGLVHFDIDPDHPRRTAPIEFQKLINQMLKTSPKFRPTIEQVLSDKIFNNMQQPQIASSGSMRGSFSRMAMASGRGIDPSGSRRSGMKAGFFVQSFSDKSISHKRRHLSKPDQSALKLVSGNRSFAQENRRQSTFA
ncbi:AGC family protein kinase [Tritrichomonas foetus]|uniref:AGC family protein kinase n=1 Tax=Tritrichomonas foetus TaxID=1144522 RepID=A0A1J4JD87_9EUKA|nr:AGC family protein kinase [Tritrichomonas foetus]|eukprot:OHS96617.1 AGC family protein kinase [Tritrichomonas foetus]